MKGEKKKVHDRKSMVKFQFEIKGLSLHHVLIFAGIYCVKAADYQTIH